MKGKKFYTKVNDEFRQSFLEKVKSSGKIVIASHKSPDDDSISSVLTMYWYLVEELKVKAEVSIVYTGEQLDSWSYFKNFEKIQFVDDLANHLEGVDTLILVDGSGWGRFSRNENISDFSGFTICIDHHQTPEDKFDLHLVDSKKLANAELLYRLFLEEVELDKEISEVVLLGILGDTGIFKFVNSDNAGVFEVAQKLVENGKINIQELAAKFQKYSEKSYVGLVELIKNSKFESIQGWPKFIYSHMSRDFVNANGLGDNDVSVASGLFSVHFTRSIEGVDWGVVITPLQESERFSLSLRSLPGSANVREMMEKTGYGGGHDRAAGGAIEAENVEEAIEELFSWMKENKPKLS